MRVEQTQWTHEHGWDQPAGALADSAQIVFLFGGTKAFREPGAVESVRRRYPKAHLLGCSTAGEIRGTRVGDDSLVTSAVEFQSTRIQGSSVTVESSADSYSAGKQLANALPGEGLVHVFVLSDGLHVNGSALVQGLTDHLPKEVGVTGGLSADGDRFQETFVVWDGHPPRTKAVAALGLYGSALRVGFGSLGGWDSFGPERVVTHSEGNVLFELDGRSALELYQEYLGEHAQGLPATGLLFPLSLRTRHSEVPVVRTILGVDEAAGSMTFAGDVPQGAIARLMRANFDRLIDGAAGAARTCREPLQGSQPDFAILISCVGRRLVLKQRVEEEVESVREVLGEPSVLAGFYSYGEISPFTPNARCELHNQTMTITAFSER